jgi:hypothetical protein
MKHIIKDNEKCNYQNSFWDNEVARDRDLKKFFLHEVRKDNQYNYSRKCVFLFVLTPITHVQYIS